MALQAPENEEKIKRRISAQDGKRSAAWACCGLYCRSPNDF
jgi:hypothetical protein